MKKAIEFLQDNLKIVLLNKDNGIQQYMVVDKETNYLFVKRSVSFKKDDLITAKKCQEDYCDWYRTGGKNVIRKYYESK